MNDLKNYQEILQEKSAQVKNFFEKYPEDSAAIAPKFFEIYEKKIRNTEPEIMFYGIYNAGKSSILNEFMGADKAEVNDKPTTDKVIYYDWNGYKIADTPGIFAPIKHEEITQEHLKKADIVIFVMSTTGSNENAENYKRMKEIADAGKKIIIVLNDKGGYMSNAVQMQEIKRKVAVNMQSVGIENVDEKYCIVEVDALIARKGRLKNNPKFLAASRIDELKNVVLTELKSTTSFEILRGGIRQLENLLAEFIKILEANENSALIKNMNRVLENFIKQKILLRRQINAYIDTQAEFLGNNLPQIIWANRNNQTDINNVVAQEISHFNEKVQREIQRQMQDVAAILELELKSFAEIKIENKNIDAEIFKNVLAQLNKVNSQISANENFAQNSGGTNFSNVGLAGKILTEGTSRILKTEIGKSLAKTALGRIIGGAIPIVGPVLTIVGVIGTLKTIFGGNDSENINAQIREQNRQERRRVEAEMQARQELTQKCRYLAENFSDELKTATAESISETLEKYETPFKMALNARANENEQLANDILKLRQILNEYDLLCAELGSK